LSNVNCPYCDAENSIYEEELNTVHETECGECDNTFTYTIEMQPVYLVHRADCLNDIHNYEQIGQVQKFNQKNGQIGKITRFKCKECDAERSVVEIEMAEFN